MGLMGWDNSCVHPSHRFGGVLESVGRPGWRSTLLAKAFYLANQMC
ncbi:Uncharacterised protein [Paucimonas lemoignei]|nr:Uncharacterised protein [Paucimonas lemoignei]